MRFLVVIPYVEPTYKPHESGERLPYRASFRVDASDRREAMRSALERFDQCSSESGVGWIREPLEDAIVVEPLD